MNTLIVITTNNGDRFERRIAGSPALVMNTAKELMLSRAEVVCFECVNTALYMRRDAVRSIEISRATVPE